MERKLFKAALITLALIVFTFGLSMLGMWLTEARNSEAATTSDLIPYAEPVFCECGNWTIDGWNYVGIRCSAPVDDSYCFSSSKCSYCIDEVNGVLTLDEYAPVLSPTPTPTRKGCSCSDWSAWDVMGYIGECLKNGGGYHCFNEINCCPALPISTPTPTPTPSGNWLCTKTGCVWLFDIPIPTPTASPKPIDVGTGFEQVEFYHDDYRNVGIWVLSDYHGKLVGIAVLPDSEYNR